MAVLKDLIVHGASRFLNGAYFKTINAESIGADAGIFNKLVATSLDAKTATIDDLTAKNATVTALLDVQGELHTNSWSNANIATIDGSFYISPTSSSADGNDVDASGYTPTGTITYNNGNYTKLVVTGTFNTSQLNLGDATNVAWPANSYVIITGDVLVGNEWYPLGTIRGKLQSQLAANANSKTITVIPIGAVIIDGDIANTSLTDGHGLKPQTLEAIRVASSAAVNGSTVLKMRKIKVSMTSYGGTYQSPIGIFMTAMGSNKKTFLDIYGGSNNTTTIPSGSGALAKPVLRIGNLSGLPKVGTVTPSGWGIYTTNGFFSGTVVAKQGIIGSGETAWTIGSGSGTGSVSYIYAPTTGPTSKTANTVGMYIGTDGINNFNTSSQYVRIYNGKIYALGADIQGVLKADTGRIGGSSGWTIAAQQISSGSLGSDNSMFLSTKNLAGTVGGKTFSSSDAAWRFTVGSHFGVDNTGALYCDTAIITGAITASALTINAGATIGGDGAKPILNSTFLKVDGNGLMLYDGSSSESTSSTVSTNNILITSDEIRIRDGQNVLAKYGSAVTIGNNSNESESSYIYIDNNDFTVFDNKHTEAFSISSDGAILEVGRRVVTVLPSDDIYSTEDMTGTYNTDYSKDIPLQTTTITIPTDSTSNANLHFTIRGVRTSGGEITQSATISLVSLIANGVAETDLGIYGEVFYRYNSNKPNVITVNPKIRIAGGQSILIKLWVELALFSKMEYTQSTSPYCSIGTRINDTTKGAYSITGGYNNEASGNYSQSFGCNTIAQGAYQTIIGKYNTAQGSNSIANTDYAFIIGNGTSDTARSNALTVDWNGTITANGYICNNIGGGSSTTHASTLQTWFNNHKSSISRNTVLSYWSNAYGNGSQYIGYFLNGYDTTPYGGFFVCHYGTPRYVGISNGTYTQYELTKTATSSRKTKENIKLMTEKEAKKLYDLNVISFDYKKGYEEGKKNQFGLIAEDCDKIIPYVVNKPNDNEDSIWGIDYVKFVPYLIKNLQLHEKTIEKLNDTVQQLMDRVDKLESEIKTLKDMVDKLESEIKTLK